ncbi:MAG TPA: hypothetical protein VFB96_04720 [Pirellulaceae bacterium]|nr:hypothetical protein [Pirellulaceae bacterium]
MTDISAPVAYGSTMLVLVSDEGVGAVVFRPTADGGATYDFRYEGNDGKKLEGAGKPLFETRNAKGDLTGELYVKAGPISVGWSKGGDSKGFIYYTPEKVQAHLAIDHDFRDRMQRVPGGEDRIVPKLDLQRFRKLKAADHADPPVKP